MPALQQLSGVLREMVSDHMHHIGVIFLVSFFLATAVRSFVAQVHINVAVHSDDVVIITNITRSSPKIRRW